MIPVVDEESIDMLTVAVEKTPIEAPLPPTLCIIGVDVVAKVMVVMKTAEWMRMRMRMNGIRTPR